MSIVRITKNIDFEMAHALEGYAGPCKHIHGHTYHLIISLAGTPSEVKSSSDWGMVMDFSDIKEMLGKEILLHYDHKLLLWEGSKLKQALPDTEALGNIRFTPYQPTCENILLEIVGRLKNALPSSVHLKRVVLKETASSSAEWHAQDNPNDA